MTATSTSYDAHDALAQASPNPHAADSERQRLEQLAQERNALNLAQPRDGILDWVNGKPSVNIVRLAAAIEDGTRFRVGPDGGIYRYSNGVYLPDGEEVIRLKAQTFLASVYKSHHVNEVVRFYADREGQAPLSFDPDPTLVIRTRDGILDVQEWTFVPYTQENASLVQVPWSVLDDTAQCPGIDTFLSDCFFGDREMVEFMYALAGYLMLTRNPLRLAFLLFGASGNNGKSIFLHLLKCLLGATNISTVPLQRLGGDDRFAPADLVGRLANICGDIGPQTAKDMSTFKQLTGGDPLRAEKKFRDSFTFVSGATPIFSANEFPGSPDTTKAYKGRWIAIEFPRTFAENAKLEAELKALGSDPAEMTGFMFRAALGARRVIAEGSFEAFMPEAVRACTERFWRTIDSFEAFVDDKLQVQASVSTAGPILYATYKQFCQENGYHALGRNKFYEKMTGLDGVTRSSSSEDRNRPFVGVRLTEIPALALVEEGEV